MDEHDQSNEQDLESVDDSSDVEPRNAEEQESELIEFDNQEKDDGDQTGEDDASGCWRIGLYGCGGCGCLTLVVALIIGIGGYYFFSNTFTFDSNAVVSKTHNIIDYELPGDERGLFAIDFYVDVGIVRSTRHGNDLILGLMKYDGAIPEKQRETLFRNFNENFEQGRFSTVAKRFTTNMNICGQQISVSQINGEKNVRDTTVSMRRYQGCFVSDDTTYCFITNGRGQDSISQLPSILTSFRCSK